MKYRIYSIILLILFVGLGFFVFEAQKPESRFSQYAFKLGLDLNGGAHLTYQADVSGVENPDEAMTALKDAIERRINVLGVSEPVVQTVQTGGNYRLSVELPGVTDISEAIDTIGATPLLEFRLFDEEAVQSAGTVEVGDDGVGRVTIDQNKAYAPTELTGRYLDRATLSFIPPANEPVVNLRFDSEGKALFAQITSDNIGNVLAIFLDGQAISTPVVRQEIKNGEAQISGGFTAEEARELVRNLNFGALPVPIELIETQTIGPSLGAETTRAGQMALMIGIMAVGVFLIFWYRALGLVAVVALFSYLIIMGTLFQIIPVVLTAAGVAGFILSIGMAVDANVLIFERAREEMRDGAHIRQALIEGSRRAWPSIRDGNFSSLISAIVLYWLSGSSVVQGFALVFGLGVLVSMLSAVIVSRTFAIAISPSHENIVTRWLFSNGFKK